MECGFRGAVGDSGDEQIRIVGRLALVRRREGVYFDRVLSTVLSTDRAQVVTVCPSWFADDPFGKIFCNQVQ